MKVFLWVAGFSLLILTSAVVSIWSAGQAVSQFEGQYPPLVLGVDSPGAIVDPDEQTTSPAGLPADRFSRHFFEERVYWPALGIDTPRTAWEYTQRGIYFQDDVGDMDAAMADYLQAAEMEDTRSCGPGLPLPADGAPCLQILRARLGNIFLESGQYTKAIAQLEFILEENPFGPGLHFELAEAYLHLGERDKAIEEFHKELGVGADKGAHQPCHQATHFELGEVLIEGGSAAEEREGRAHLTEYLRQTLLHCDSSPYKILKARKLLEDHGGPLDIQAVTTREEHICPDRLKGPLDQVLAIPESQITARIGCNPVGTRFHEEVS